MTAHGVTLLETVVAAAILAATASAGATIAQAVRRADAAIRSSDATARATIVLRGLVTGETPSPTWVDSADVRWRLERHQDVEPADVREEAPRLYWVREQILREDERGDWVVAIERVRLASDEDAEP